MDSTAILFSFFLFFIIAWCLIWKGFALWKSARNHQKVWFVFLLIINTLDLLEIIYMAFFQRDDNAKGKTKAKKEKIKRKSLIKQ